MQHRLNFFPEPHGHGSFRPVHLKCFCEPLGPRRRLDFRQGSSFRDRTTAPRGTSNAPD